MKVRANNDPKPVPKVLNPAIYSLVGTLMIWGFNQSGYPIPPESAASLIGLGAAFIGYMSPRAK